MNIFLDIALPQQPAFIYAQYGATATVNAGSTAAGYLASDVLQADESGTWKPAGTGTNGITIGNPGTVDVGALQGKAMKGVTLRVLGSATDGGSQTELLPPTVMGHDTTVWFRLPAATTLPFLIYTFSGHSTAFEVAHIASGVLQRLPFLEDGACLAPLQAEGEHLISHAGFYLGSVTDRVMRPFDLNFGQVDAVEEALFAAMVKSCVQSPQGLFFVPDTARSTVHFGWIDKKYSYEPKMSKGLYQIPAIPFMSRAV